MVSPASFWLFQIGWTFSVVVIPNSVTSIDNYTFEYCSSLTSIDIPNSVISIGDEAFFCCTNLTNVFIGNSVTSIGYDAFEGCSITCVYITDLDAWCSISFGNYELTFGSNPLCHAHHLYLKGEEINDLVIPNSITSIGDGTFFCFGGLTSVTIPNTVTSIGNYAFLGCSSLTSIKVETGNPKYDSRNNCNAIIETATNALMIGCQNTTIPNSVTSIGNYAFSDCTGLTSVTIGSGVTAIGAKAFNYCNALDTVKCLGTVPPVMASTDCFTNTAYNRATLLVPRQQIEAYQAADYWYKFAHIDGWGSAGRGDIDGDGEVSIRDVTTMIDAILTGEHEGVYFESADLNLNGRLDIGDVTTIIDMLLNDIE